MGREKAQNMMMRQAILSATGSEFAAVLERLVAPGLIYTTGEEDEGGGEAARRGPRRRRGAQAVTGACCNVYAGAAGSGAFLRVDLGRQAMQPGVGALECLL